MNRVTVTDAFINNTLLLNYISNVVDGGIQTYTISEKLLTNKCNEHTVGDYN